jgi:hypothetical protein
MRPNRTSRPPACWPGATRKKARSFVQNTVDFHGGDVATKIKPDTKTKPGRRGRPRLYRQKDAALATTFFQQLASGEQLSNRDPVYVLREVLIRRKQRDPRNRKNWGIDEQAIMAAQLIITWNAIRQQKRLFSEALQWKIDEDFPEIV